ncbi:hypothetical protein LBMAG30_16290 [Comamonadaceae bacterium]|nr:hypothetical protein LBMAG30_16290 [Comamonadaceae bacterium]
MLISEDCMSLPAAAAGAVWAKAEEINTSNSTKIERYAAKARARHCGGQTVVAVRRPLPKRRGRIVCGGLG